MLEDSRISDLGLLIVGCCRTSERLDCGNGVPLLEHVDTVEVERVSAQVEVDAARGITCETNDIDTLDEVRIALFRLHEQSTRNNDHSCILAQARVIDDELRQIPAITEIAVWDQPESGQHGVSATLAFY